MAGTDVFLQATSTGSTPSLAPFNLRLERIELLRVQLRRGRSHTDSKVCPTFLILERVRRHGDVPAYNLSRAAWSSFFQRPLASDGDWLGGKLLITTPKGQRGPL